MFVTISEGKYDAAGVRDVAAGVRGIATSCIELRLCTNTKGGTGRDRWVPPAG